MSKTKRGLRGPFFYPILEPLTKTSRDGLWPITLTEYIGK